VLDLLAAGSPQDQVVLHRGEVDLWPDRKWFCGWSAILFTFFAVIPKINFYLIKNLKKYFLRTQSSLSTEDNRGLFLALAGRQG
jgi:hypothetical protein